MTAMLPNTGLFAVSVGASWVFAGVAAVAAGETPAAGVDSPIIWPKVWVVGFASTSAALKNKA